MFEAESEKYETGRASDSCGLPQQERRTPSLRRNTTNNLRE
ncbi:hypothetical protein JTE90_022851, partial [Oedothorax gibbosus]